MTSFVVSFLIAFTAMSLSVLVAHFQLSLADAEQLWLSLLGIYALASFVYGAIFSMLGTWFFKRAMVVAAGYLIGSEVFLATVPAVVSKFTMRYHLQELGIHWIGFFVPFDSEYEYRMIYGPAWPIWANILIIVGTGLTALILGILIITSQQYITSEDGS